MTDSRGSAPVIQTSWPKGAIEPDPNASGSTQAFTTPNSVNGSPSQARHQRFVLADPVAFGYLEEDETTTVLDRSRQLQGYQCYLVEQWACSRIHPTFIVTVYTGDLCHTITVGVLSVPANEEAWSPRLKVYFQALLRYHARRKETPMGILMTTNLSGFPSSLTVILVPDGDVPKHREAFFVNENLKRLGCSGRMGLTISDPSNATQAKFHQLYRTSENIQLKSSVIELVKLCQVALMLYGQLEPEYADGLLCDVTEKAIMEWWVALGTDLYNIEPTDGILGPTTVAALLGNLIGARNRLNAYGAPISKDVFDVESTKRAIAYFQNAQRIHKSRRLDRQTLDRLHKATARQAAGEGWTVPRAVKSTVAELSGKGGEMVMEMVGVRSKKASIAEIETIDIERFSQLVKGERAKWLWLGKARKRTTRDIFSQSADGDDQLVFQGDKQGGYSWQGQRKDSTIMHLKPRHKHTSLYGMHPADPRTSGEGQDVDPIARKTLLKRAKGRVKEAVGMKGHGYAKSKDDSSLYTVEDKSDESLHTPDTAKSPNDSPSADQTLVEKYKNDELKSQRALPSDVRSSTRILASTSAENKNLFLRVAPNTSMHKPGLGPRTGLSPGPPRNNTPERCVAGFNALEAQWQEKMSVDERPGQNVGLLLRRTRSLSVCETDIFDARNDEYWPRSLSFSTAEDTVLSKPLDDFLIKDEEADDDGLNPEEKLTRALLRADQSRFLRRTIAQLGADVGGWVERKVSDIEALDVLAAQDAEQLNSLYYPRKDEYLSLQEGSREIVAEEKQVLKEAMKELETLGAKLEYEIAALKGKVEDVESAVMEFERQVIYTEERVSELIRIGNEETWLGWTCRMMTGGKREISQEEQPFGNVAT